MYFIGYFFAYSVYLPPVGRRRSMHRRNSVLSVILLKLKWNEMKMKKNIVCSTPRI